MLEDDRVPLGRLTGIAFNVATQEDVEKLSVVSIESVSEVTGSKLGLPNPSSVCSTCGVTNIRHCEGHYGHISLEYTTIHPYFLSEVAKLLNQICPSCKSIRKERGVKVPNHAVGPGESSNCVYCHGSYPRVKFKVSTKDEFKRSSIIGEIFETSLKRLQDVPEDFWNFLPRDPHIEDCNKLPKRRILSHAQVHVLIKHLNPKFLRKFVPRLESMFVNSFPVTPNRHRVEEFIHGFSNERRLTFDKRTRVYRRLVGFRGNANELGSRVLESFKASKLHADSVDTKLILPQEKKSDCPSKIHASRWMKDVILSKRSDHCFRMVVHGDPKIKLDEIGIPTHIAERMLIPETLNSRNLEKLDEYWSLGVFEDGAISVKKDFSVVRLRPTDKLRIGDTIYRPLRDGDIVLINRPPSIHQHSLIALSARVLRTSSVLSLNPLCCSPFKGDFDGDCLHGYVPQSVDTRSELRDLVALDQQLFNGQSGKSLLSLSHDSLTAAHLMMDDGTVMNLYQMQQLQMFCKDWSPEFCPAIVKAPAIGGPGWTGKQAFSMILPRGFDYSFSLDNVCIERGEIISASEGSSWLGNHTEGNLFHCLLDHSRDKFLDILFSAQDMLNEWLSMTGLSVSLLDLSLTADPRSRENLMHEVFFGLRDSEKAGMYPQLLNSNERFFAGDEEESSGSVSVEADRLCYERQRSATMSQASLDGFKGVFRDVQNLAFKYAERDNSLLTMFKAGSKGNMAKLVQQSMCLGFQSSLSMLPFRMPRELSCEAWNHHKYDSARESSKSFVPSGVVGSSFLTGLNPLEAFINSVTNRESAFSDNAQLPGTLSRKLNFFLRDIYTTYDGTVRSAYGNQVIQFSYDNDETDDGSQAVGGHPVGILAGCAISEAAYSALDQPVSLLETSPLLNLKNALECGARKVRTVQTMSIHLSGKLGRLRHGFEYGALEVKNHLEGLLLSEITSSVSIVFAPQSGGKKRLSPWVCHFHIFKDISRKRRLTMKSIINILNQRCTSPKTKLLTVKITSNDCCSESDPYKENGFTFCVTVSMVEIASESLIELSTIQNSMIPFLLGTVVKGFQEIKRVDIVWSDRPQIPKPNFDPSGELYLRVTMSGKRVHGTFWNLLKNHCLPIMDLIDWSRTYPDNISELCSSHGIDCGWRQFINSMESAVSDVGKTILPHHLLLVANSLSVTGEFVALTAKGLSQQRELISVASPFTQACFSGPATSFIKAAKEEVKDGLVGSLDALGWGNSPPFGSGGQFELIYSGKVPEINKATNIFDLLRAGIKSEDQNSVKKPDIENNTTVNFGAQLLYKYERTSLKGNKKLGITDDLIKKLFKVKDIWDLAYTVNRILQEYPINTELNDVDYSTLMMALYFHPRRDSKIGSGAKYIKVANHPKHQNSRCFMLVRKDGTTEDFSYRKCIVGAFEIVDPKEAEKYTSKILRHGPDRPAL